jgi:hypothetical protein
LSGCHIRTTGGPALTIARIVMPTLLRGCPR